jgi:hypothetical protein
MGNVDSCIGLLEACAGAAPKGGQSAGPMRSIFEQVFRWPVVLAFSRKTWETAQGISCAYGPSASALASLDSSPRSALTSKPGSTLPSSWRSQPTWLGTDHPLLSGGLSKSRSGSGAAFVLSAGLNSLSPPNRRNPISHFVNFQVIWKPWSSGLSRPGPPGDANRGASSDGGRR